MSNAIYAHYDAYAAVMDGGYYAPNGGYAPSSAGSSPTSPSHPLAPLPSSVGPARTHPSLGTSSRRRPYDAMPLDAPTASRTYSSPSMTSRRDVPAFFASRRPPSHPSDEEEDELTEEPPAANATDQEKIEYKRRQNTLAARRSRKRKLMHQQALEEAVDRLTREKEIWRTRAFMLCNMLRTHGITAPEFPAE
ncbi:BZIP domain-containing protein [Mycena chlorophos]|uniref:BZIP domain-containing protein n=1 Tax=Mycena chlorophos TaxID=658473 RepID=A0A8H6SMX7_MYCCL|nr:BZIP domain-containing protein [Mycena chlorophos]